MPEPNTDSTQSEHYQHDEAYKNLFSHSPVIRDLCTEFIPETWINQLDFTTLEPFKSSFVSPNFRRREEDLIWRARWKDSPDYLYFLLGFQSQIETFMNLRCAGYGIMLYQDLTKKTPTQSEPKKSKQDNLLPPIVPIVIYNGAKAWNAERDIHGALNTKEAALKKYCPQIEYLLIDIQTYAGTINLERPNLVSAIIYLENSRSAEEILFVVRKLRTWLKDPEHISLRRTFVMWLKRILLPKNLPGIFLSEINELVEIESMLAETVQQWYIDAENKGLAKGLEKGKAEGILEGEAKGKAEGILEGEAKGKAEGIAEGEAKGKAEGEAKGKAKALLELLRIRFGEQPEAVQAQIMAMNEMQTSACMQVIFEATTVAEVLRQAEGV